LVLPARVDSYILDSQKRTTPKLQNFTKIANQWTQPDVRFGSLAGKPPQRKIRLCPLLSESGRWPRFGLIDGTIAGEPKRLKLAHHSIYKQIDHLRGRVDDVPVMSRPRLNRFWNSLHRNGCSNSSSPVIDDFSVIALPALAHVLEICDDKRPRKRQTTFR
jgi:hypothetical protein